MNTDTIFNIQSSDDFNTTSIEVFNYQYQHNQTYRLFCKLLKVKPETVTHYSEIPFLPIQFFKSHAVTASMQPATHVFSSSGTTGSVTSKHFVTDIAIYERSFREAFELHYGAITEYAVLALLPSYLERTGSSLIYMVNDMITKSGNPDSGFYLNNLDELKTKLVDLDNSGQKVLLIGVSFALLDLIEQHSFQLKNTVIMETGGMKGRRKELIRTELHEILTQGFGVSHIHSEYGMTELLSQGYSKGNGIFTCPPWMKIIARDTEDALTLLPENKNGGINVIDLANVNSCSFIATQDLGKVYHDGSFEIFGRFDNSDIRGCNLMVI